MPLQLSCADFSFPLLDHDAVLDLIKALGVPAVDIGLFENRSHLQPSDQFRDVQRSATVLREKLDDRGLLIADVFLQLADDASSMAVNHPNEARRQQVRDGFLRLLEYAAHCGAAHVTISAGVHFRGRSRALSWSDCCEELAWRVERAAAADITFGVEPGIGSIAPRPEAVSRLLSEVPGLTLTLDYSHFTRLGIPDRDIEPLIESASHFHIRGARKGALQTSLAESTIDFARVLRVLEEVGYDRYLCLEYVWTEWERCNRVDNLSETVLFRDLLRSLA